MNATCGQDRPEVFCRRPLDKEGRKSNQCKPMLCDGKKNNIRRATDGSKESWISPTLENGLEYEYVTVLLDMKQVCVYLMGTCQLIKILIDQVLTSFFFWWGRD